MLSTMKNTVSSETAKTAAKDFYHNLLDVFSLDPVAALDLIKDIKNLPSTIRDGIFFECFEAYILNLNEYDYKKKEFVEDNLKKMAISLAEVSPNDEADYAGDPNPDKPEKFLQFLQFSSIIKKNHGGCVYVTYG